MIARGMMRRKAKGMHGGKKEEIEGITATWHDAVRSEGSYTSLFPLF
jgi:hypothetical protein